MLALFVVVVAAVVVVVVVTDLPLCEEEVLLAISLAADSGGPDEGLVQIH